MASTTIETRTYLNQSRAFCGSIKCPIRRLRFESITIDPRQLDLKNVARILEIFNLEGCRRLKLQNHVPALISQTVLHALLQGVPGGRLEDEVPSLVDPKHDLKCLHGRHRIEAAKKYLHPDDKWWIVDLYVDDLGEVEVNELRQEYSNAKNFYDGDIFRHLRQAHLAGNASAKARWLCKLSRAKIKDVNLLEKRASRDPQTQHLQNAFDDLLPFTGLWPALQIGTFHRLLSLRCPEEMTRYLISVKAAWAYMLGEEEELRFHLDAGTVTILEGRCPKLSAEDERLLQRNQSHLFPAIPVHRAQSILSRVQKIDYIIPSIHTFLEDTKILEPCAKIMKRLLPAVCRTSILQEFGQLHNGQTSWSLQTSEASYCRREEESSDTTHRGAYRQLWLYKLRHFPEMIGQPLRRDPPRTKSPLLGVELVWWYRFTALAEACGYAEVDNTYRRGEEADYQMAQTFLQQVRPPQLYGTSMGRSVQRMVDLLGKDFPPTVGADAPPVVDTYGLKCGPDITSRCGAPFERAFRKDQMALFLKNIDQDLQHGQQDIGSFMVKRETFHKFFGSSDSSYESHTQSSPSAPGPLRHHSDQIDDFTSTRPPDISSAEAGNAIDPPDEISLTPSSPSAPADLNLPALPVAFPHPPTTVTQSEALRMFEELSQEWNSDRLVILKQESSGMFSILTFNRQDREGMSRILPAANDHEYQVADVNRSKRIKLTSPTNIPDARVVMIAGSQVRAAYEESFEEEL